MANNEKVFKSDLALAIYGAYEEFLSTPDFSGHKTIDMANFVADKLSTKGYTIPVPGFCVEQVYHTVVNITANFMRAHAKDGVFREKDLSEEDLKTFKDLMAAYTVLDEWRKKNPALED